MHRSTALATGVGASALGWLALHFLCRSVLWRVPALARRVAPARRPHVARLVRGEVYNIFAALAGVVLLARRVVVPRGSYWR